MGKLRRTNPKGREYKKLGLFFNFYLATANRISLSWLLNAVAILAQGTLSDSCTRAILFERHRFKSHPCIFLLSESKKNVRMGFEPPTFKKA